MAYFKRTFSLTDEEKRKVGNMVGKTATWMLEGRSIGYMSEKLNLSPQQVERNMEETLYILRKQLGFWRYIKMLFVK